MRTRLGMLIRAGASNREMAGALGVNIKLLYTLVFGLGAALAGLAGLMQAPILTVQIGMGENILILAFVIIIIGGIGSIRGALVAALLVGLIDTIGRAFLPDLLRLFLSSRTPLGGHARNIVHDDLSGDGDRAGGAAAGSVPGFRQMTRLAHAAQRGGRCAAHLPGAGPGLCHGHRQQFLDDAVHAHPDPGDGGDQPQSDPRLWRHGEFGHAAYLGIGGYAIGIFAHEGVGSGLIQWPVAIAASALFALGVGALSLRTRGLYFIMITLAFAQLVYYFGVGLDRYGGDDGLQIYRRSQFVDPINLSNRTQFYYWCFVLLVASIYFTWRIVNSRFGLVIQGARSNDRRMQAIGFPTYRYRLICFVIAGTICGLAGALLANHTEFVSPAMMHWTRSGDLIVMVVLGGMASTFGPLIGAVTLLVLEETLPILIKLVATPFVGAAASRAAEYWQIVLGPLFLLVVLFARGGINGLLESMRRE